MKIRNGFVSNSSSSSFVVLGARIPVKELTKMGWYDDEDGENYDVIPKGISIYYMEGSDGWIIGKRLCNSDGNSGLDYADWPFDKLNEVKMEVEAAIKQPARLIMGTRPS